MKYLLAAAAALALVISAGCAEKRSASCGYDRLTDQVVCQSEHSYELPDLNN